MNTSKKQIRPAVVPSPVYMTDEQLNLLGCRFQAARIRPLLNITFEAYVMAPQAWDRIAKHLQGGGGCCLT